LSLQSEEEARYRLTLAEGYLERARKALASEDFSDTVSEAQLCVENAAKAVVSCFRIPGWSHDPSAELREVLESNQLEIKKSLGSDFLRKLGWLAEASHLVAPEHGRASYGDFREEYRHGFYIPRKMPEERWAMLRLPSRQRQSLLWHGTLNKARNRLD